MKRKLSIIFVVFRLCVLFENAAAKRRIYNGTVTTIQNYPSDVIIFYKNHHQCGGSILSQYHVLTAAHCLLTSNGTIRNTADYLVKYGTDKVDETTGILTNISRVYPHVGFHHNDNDIGVITVKSPIQFSNVAAPAVLRRTAPKTGYKLVVVGHGFTVYNGQHSNDLQKRTITIFDKDQCKKIYSRINITENMICAFEKNAATCPGDSGSPVFTLSGVQAGLVSAGPKYANKTVACGHPTNPAIITNIANYQEWINRATQSLAQWVN